MEMIVKRLLSYACCLAGAIILNSSLLTLNSLAASVVGGEVGPFVSWPDAVAADEAHTPGSAEFYKPVDEMTVYDSGVVYRNGAVVTNVPFPTVREYREPDSDYGWGYDVSMSIQPGERILDGQQLVRPIRMNQFDVSWLARTNNAQTLDPPVVAYYAYGTGCVKKLISPPVMLPVSRRMDSDTRSALLASSEAYFERLYWGSKGDVNEWDTRDLGRTTPGPGFLFNFSLGQIVVTNKFEYAYPTNDMRLLEFPNPRRQLAAMARMLPSYVEICLTNDPERTSHPAWLWRPNWLLEDVGWYDRSAYLWWSSSLMPPVSDRFVIVHGYRPAYPDDFTLLPDCDWTSEDVRTSDRLRWECRGFTLDNLAGGAGGFGEQSDDTRFPCTRLLYELTADISGEWDLKAVPSWREQTTVQDFLLAHFGHAGLQSINPTNALARYNSCFEEITRRLSPSSYAGIDHFLAAMNATVHIPPFYIYCHNDRCLVSRGAEYAGNGTFGGEWRDDGYFHVQYGEGTHGMTRVSASNSVTKIETRSKRFVNLDVYEISQGDVLPGSGAHVMQSGLEAFLSGDFPSYFSERERETCVIDSFYVDGPMLVASYYTVAGERLAEHREMNVPREMVFISKTSVPYMVPSAARASVRRSYEYDACNDYDLQAVTGLLQPPTDAGNRVVKAEYANAWMRVANGERKWKLVSDHGYTRGTWEGIMRQWGRFAVDELNQDALDFYGVDYRRPDEFAPMPSGMSYSVTGGEVRYGETDARVDAVSEYPLPYNWEYPRITGYFVVTNSIWALTNTYNHVSNETVTAEVAAYVETAVAPDGWSWVVEAVTNEVSRSVDASESVDYGVDVGVVGGTERIVELERWPDEPGYAGDIDMSETTNFYTTVQRTLVRDSEVCGYQTNVVCYYDMHLVVTNVTTDVTPISYCVHEEEVLGRITTPEGSVTREWDEPAGWHRPTHEFEHPVAFQLDKMIYISGGSASWVAVNPITQRIFPIEMADFPLLLGTGTIEMRPLPEDMAKIVYDAKFPPMPEEEYHAREGFRPITKTTWNWKSMKLKGE